MGRSSEAWADQGSIGAGRQGVNSGAPGGAASVAPKRPRGLLSVAAVKARCEVDGATHCWLWQGARCSNGMPQIWSLDYARAEKRAQAGPVAVWQMAHDRALPVGKMVFRGCGRKLCLNPVHLRLAGSRAELMGHVARAGHLKGRGVEQHRAALVKAREAAGIVSTPAALVRQIVAAPRTVTNVALAARLGVSIWTVSNIRLGKTRAGAAATPGAHDAAGG